MQLLRQEGIEVAETKFMKRPTLGVEVLSEGWHRRTVQQQLRQQQGLANRLTCPTASEAAANTAAAPRPASVPSTLTAPSVPRGTSCRFVMR